MIEHVGGNAQPTIDREEHRSVNGVNAKAVVLYGYDYAGAALHPLATVESADSPGVWGLVVLNSDGTALSAGGGTVTTYHLLTESGDGLLTEDGNYLRIEA